MVFIEYSMSLAFSLYLLASVLPVWSSAALATKFPKLPRMTNQSATDVSLAGDTKKYLAETLCSPNDIQVEHNAWQGALQYAQALASWQPGGSFQPAMDLYMGNDSNGQLAGTLLVMTGHPRQDTIVPTLLPSNNQRTSQYLWRTESTRRFNLARASETLCLL